MNGVMMPDSFEEWRQSGTKVFVTVDHGDVTRGGYEFTIGVGDNNGIAWMSPDEARWLIERLNDALLAASATRSRRLKEVK